MFFNDEAFCNSINLKKYLGILSRTKDHDSIVGRENIKKLCELYVTKLKEEGNIKGIFNNQYHAEKSLMILSSFNELLPGLIEEAMENFVMK